LRASRLLDCHPTTMAENRELLPPIAPFQAIEADPNIEGVIEWIEETISKRKGTEQRLTAQNSHQFEGKDLAALKGRRPSFCAVQ